MIPVTTLKPLNVVAYLSGLGILLIAGCSQQPTTQNPQTPTPTPTPQSSSKPQTGEINLYSSRHYDTDKQLYAQFTQKTGIKVNLIEGKDDELIERIKSEGNNSPADVLITVDIARLWRSQQEGIFQPIKSPVLEAAIPAHYRSPEGYWFGFSKRARVIVYNSDRVKPEQLSTYEDLANPKWKGKICVRSSGNVYNQSLVASKIAEKGVAETEKWVKGLVSNFARQPEGNDTNQIEAVSAGECDLALVNHYYFARMRQSKDPKTQQIVANIGVFFPNQQEGGTHINISGAGVAVKAPHQKEAVQFLEYLVTPEAQESFANANNEYPMISTLAPNPTITSFGKFKESNLNITSYGEQNAEAVKLMDRAGWK